MSARYKSNFPLILMIITVVLFGGFVVYMILNPRAPKEKPIIPNGLPKVNYESIQNK